MHIANNWTKYCVEKNNLELPIGGAIIYGGDETQLRGNISVYPAARFHELLLKTEEV